MRTLTVPASFEVVIKRSRFIAHASRVDSQADTLDFYQSVADPAATHFYRELCLRVREIHPGILAVDRVIDAAAHDVLR